MNAIRNEESQTKPQPREALFISHANPEDNAFSLWLGAKLAAMGYEVWADVMQLHGGADWQRELEQALRTRAFKQLVVCTPDAVEKQGVRNEIEIASKLGSVLNSVCEAGARLFHGGGRRLRRTTDAVGKSMVNHITLAAA